MAGLDRLYVADDRATTNGGGIQKWTFDGTIWTLANTFEPPGTVGARGLTGRIFSGTAVALFATTAESTANRLMTMIDDGTSSPAFTVLATAPAKTVFRGVDFSPVTPGTVPLASPGALLTLAAMLLGAGAMAVRSRRERIGTSVFEAT